MVVAYGRSDHDAWCTQKGMLCSWNLDRRSVNHNKADSAIEIPSSLMAIACHPEIPSLIAGGTFNGVLMVVDTAKPSGHEIILRSSPLDAQGHTEPITSVQVHPFHQLFVCCVLDFKFPG